MRALAVITLAAAAVLAGCRGTCRGGGFWRTDLPANKLSELAAMAKGAYRSDSRVLSEFGRDYRVQIISLPGFAGRCLLLANQEAQYVAVRGTENVRNALADAKYSKVKDSRLDTPGDANVGYRRRCRFGLRGTDPFRYDD